MKIAFHFKIGLLLVSLMISSTYASTYSLVDSTKLRDVDCGLDLTSLNKYFACDGVSGATKYQFEFTNTFNQSVTTKTTQYRSMSLQYAGISNYGTIFEVRVRAYVDGVWGDYGTVCTVTSPELPKLRSADCGRELNSFLDYFVTDQLQGYNTYDFQFTNLSTEEVSNYITSNRTINLKNAGLTATGVTYNVRVRANNGSSWSPYGDECILVAPLTVNTATKIRASDCGRQLASNDYIAADYVVGADAYEFEFVNRTTLFPSYRAVGHRSVSLGKMGLGTALDVSYDVRVRSRVGGVWQEFGQSCVVYSLSSPNKKGLTSVAVGEDAPVFYPNPSNGTYLGIKISSTIKTTEPLVIYDMVGNIVYTDVIYLVEGFNDISINFSNRLKSGVYFVALVGVKERIVIE